MPRSSIGIVLLVTLRLLRDLWALAAEPLRYTNLEESYNATESWLLLHADIWHLVPALQYKAFCGGCTVMAGLGAPLLWLGGDHLLAWKALALAWTAATLVLAWLAVDRGLGRPAAWAALVALVLAPAGLQDLSLMLWGNHAELALPLFAALALLGSRHRFALGLVLGLAFWFCRTALYFDIVLLPLALVRPDRRRVVAGFLLGLAPLLVPVAGGQVGPYRLGLDEQLLPEGLVGAVDRLQQLVSPRWIGPRLAMVRGADGTPALVAAAAGAAVLVWRRRWVWLLLPAAFLVAFCVTGFHVPLIGRVVPVVNARYHAPWLLWLTLLPALGAAETRRWWAFPLLLGPMIVGTRLPALPTPLVLRLPAAYPSAFAVSAARHFEHPPSGAHSATLACIGGLVAGAQDDLPADSEDARLCHGLRLGGGRWSDDRIEQTNLWLAGLPPDEAADLGRGMGVAVGRWMAAGPRPPSMADTVERLRAPDGDCPLCSAAGAVVIAQCDPPGARSRQPTAERDPSGMQNPIGDCIADRAGGHADIAWGAGVAWWTPWRDPLAVDAITARVGLDFAAGAQSPLAGVDGAL